MACSLVLFLNCISFIYANNPRYSQTGVVISNILYVVDGDTIHIKDKDEWKKIRL